MLRDILHFIEKACIISEIRRKKDVKTRHSDNFFLSPSPE